MSFYALFVKAHEDIVLSFNLFGIMFNFPILITCIISLAFLKLDFVYPILKLISKYF